MPHIDLQIEDYIRGTLDAASIKTLEAHLHHCPECQDDVEAMKTLLRVQKQTDKIDPAYALTILPRIRFRIAEGSAARNRDFFNWSWIGTATTRIVLPVGAMLLAVMFLSRVQVGDQAATDVAGIRHSVDGLASEDLVEYVSLERASSDVVSIMNQITVALNDRMLIQSGALPNVTEGLESLQSPSEVYDLLADMDEAAVDNIIAELNQKPAL
jgi:anti-sigma factor RsiW